MRPGVSIGRQVAAGFGIVASYALIPFVILVVVAITAGRSPELSSLFALKTVAVTAALVATTAATHRSWHPRVLLGLAAVGFALCPSTWAARTFLAQLWVDPGPAAIAIDRAGWLAVELRHATGGLK